MNRYVRHVLSAMVTFLIVLSGCAAKTTKRVGMVVGLRSDKIAEYKTLHADGNPGVRDLLRKYNMRNLNIFLVKMDDGKYYEFGFYEYVGDNYEEDMAKLAAEPRNKKWLTVCDPMQV